MPSSLRSVAIAAVVPCRRAAVRALSVASVLFLGASPASAEEPRPPPSGAAATVPHPYAYGILVGNNAGGAGQQPLRYAEDDARKVADVLRQLGRFGAPDMRVLSRPDAAKVLATIDDVAQKMKVHAQKGEQAVLVFYYSGHAKASAFNLGSEELAIAALRDKLRQIPSTFTLVILDACQSGQFARVKGAEPAADFSFNSVSRLTTKGVAVMASSSGQELSQESDALKGSYFTHHLVTALRGAADNDGDGRVSLDEAYRYAYRRTLASTAQTQVGSQHVTLDIDVAGQGDVPVTYPSDAKSQLELPAPLEAKVLVVHKASGNVVAEVQKAPGAPLRLAFAGGSYEATVRTGNKVLGCKLALADDRVTVIDLGSCDDVTKAGMAKGDSEDGTDGTASEFADSPNADRPLDSDAKKTPEDRAAQPSLEVGVGFAGRRTDAYTERLEEFGYAQDDSLFRAPKAHAAVAFAYPLSRHFSVGARLATLSGDRFSRSVAGASDTFSWSGYGGMAFVRGSVTAFGSAPKWTLSVYGQAGGGATVASTTLEVGGSGAPSETTDETEFGWMVGAAAGFEIRKSHFAYFMQAGYDYAPTMRALTGETHDVGGWSYEPVGLRYYF